MAAATHHSYEWSTTGASPITKTKWTDSQQQLTTPQTAEEMSQLSPMAALHRSIIEKKALVSSIDDSAAALRSTPPPAPVAVPYCAVHTASAALAAMPTLLSTLPLSHPRARPSYCSVSSTCCLPRASYWNTRCSCIFSALPDEILLFNVFDFLAAPDLCTLQAVCTRWKFLSTDPMLWREVDLSRHARRITDDDFEGVLERTGANVHTLKLCNLKALTTNSMHRLGEAHLATNATLRSLHLCSIRSVDFSVLSTLLSAGGVATSLREISLFGCVNVDDACVQLIRRQCVRLADLSVRGCLKLTDAAFADDAEEEFTDKSPLGDEMENEFDLTRSFSSSSFASTSSYQSSTSADDLSGRFAYLTALNVANCKLLTDVGLTAILRHTPLMQKLNMHGLNPSDSLVDAISAYCPRLHTLHMSSANPFGGNTLLTDTGIEYIAARLPHMQCLNLQGSSRLTDSCLAPLIRGCRQLEKLNLGGCFKLTDAGVAAICEGEATSRLTHLSLFQCMHITDASVRLVADRLARLQHLDMHSCAAVTDAAIDHLTQTHAGEAVQDDDQEQEGSLMARSSSRAPTPTAAHLAVSYRLPHLQSLDVGSCRKITADAVARIKQCRPEVVVTHY